MTINHHLDLIWRMMLFYRIFLLATTLTLSCNNTFAMDPVLSHYEQAIVAQQPLLPPISFYYVSNHAELFQWPIPHDKGLFVYPKLLTPFILQEPYCFHWYHNLCEKIFTMNKAILATKNINAESIEHYARRLAAEQFLVQFVWYNKQQSILPVYFIPQFHPVYNDQDLQSVFSFNEKGFYSYPEPRNFLVNTNLLKQAYHTTLKINLIRAHEIGLFKEHIEIHGHEILTTLECYQYDLKVAQQGNI